MRLISRNLFVCATTALLAACIHTQSGGAAEASARSAGSSSASSRYGPSLRRASSSVAWWRNWSFLPITISTLPT